MRYHGADGQFDNRQAISSDKRSTTLERSRSCTEDVVWLAAGLESGTMAGSLQRVTDGFGDTNGNTEDRRLTGDLGGLGLGLATVAGLRQEQLTGEFDLEVRPRLDGTEQVGERRQ
ncbi:hypothetical protein F443_16373 [Phytophthora nicotianae P1569]|uniref:Uncharacterized protein n=1 Tax=Phytophthora nicotianae P1569 TaxID=1317065 RepID=V9EF03_PHYNI|nr:hypothetical protein F443_16373 [Phytophthora nicotianae P1569]